MDTLTASIFRIDQLCIIHRKTFTTLLPRSNAEHAPCAAILVMHENKITVQNRYLSVIAWLEEDRTRDDYATECSKAKVENILQKLTHNIFNNLQDKLILYTFDKTANLPKIGHCKKPRQ